MKAKIIATQWIKEYDTKYGKMHLHEIKYNDKTAFYNSKSKDQKKFVINQEAEFTEETRTKNDKSFLIIKPIQPQGQSNYGRKVKQEQSKYSGFAMAYAKDLVVSGAINIADMYKEAENMIKWMVAEDKKLQS